MEQFHTKNGVSLRAHKGDAMTLLAFDLISSLRKDLAGFTVQYSFKVGNKKEEYFMFNRLKFPRTFFENNPEIPFEDRNSTLYSPIQKFNWVHVPNTNVNTQKPIFADYTYSVTPRYIKNGILLSLDSALTVSITINVSAYSLKSTKVGFTRGFVSSVAYAKRFNVENNSVRPKGNKDSLLFDITQKADTATRFNPVTRKNENVDYTFEEQHKWLGWQARDRIIEFLDAIIKDSKSSAKVFAYDLNEPEICKRLLVLANQNRLQIILDNAGTHGESTSFEKEFENLFKSTHPEPDKIFRGHFQGLAHCKVMIHLKDNKAVRVLTGSTNFSTNGLYINSNHVLVFESDKIAQLYNKIFDASFGSTNMTEFKGSDLSVIDHEASTKITITFAPHKKIDANRIFERISSRIRKSNTSELLFAIMKDNSISSILDSVQQQVRNEKVFTYGITDSISDNSEYSVFLYKPNSLRGIRVAAKGIENVLPKPFGKVPKVDGYAIHHKFIVVNFKGTDPVVYCGSSNLAFGPEQSNGDNLLEIRDKDIVTAFAIEALRLVDHFHWRNNELKISEMNLDDLSDSDKAWSLAWFNPNDLKNKQRLLYIKS